MSVQLKTFGSKQIGKVVVFLFAVRVTRVIVITHEFCKSLAKALTCISRIPLDLLTLEISKSKSGLNDSNPLFT